VVEGGTTTITVDASDVAGAADPLTYGFDCKNDGYWEIYSQAGNTAECIYQDNGEYEAQVRVSDGDGGWAFGSTTVVVNNALPVVGEISLSPESPLIGGGKVSASASFTDAGVLDFPVTSMMDADEDDEDLPAAPSECVVDYGDGTVQHRPIVGGDTCYGLGHQYHASGTYEIRITVGDKDGGEGTATASYEVLNVPPSVESLVVTPLATDEGGLITVSAAFTDPDPADTFTCEIDYGDGTAPAVGQVTGTQPTGYTCTGAPRAYADNTTPPETGYTITVTVTDSYEMSDSETATHVVANVPPTVNPPVTVLEPSLEGSSVTASATFSDPGTADTFTCKVSYGDGTAEVNGTVTGHTCTGPQHTYVDNTMPPETGYLVKVTVTDKDGGVGD
jgi:hypothetical protein